MPQTENYKWENKDLIGRGAFGFVYKVSFLFYFQFKQRTQK